MAVPVRVQTHAALFAELDSIAQADRHTAETIASQAMARQRALEARVEAILPAQRHRHPELLQELWAAEDQVAQLSRTRRILWQSVERRVGREFSDRIVTVVRGTAIAVLEDGSGDEPFVATDIILDGQQVLITGTVNPQDMPATSLFCFKVLAPGAITYALPASGSSLDF